MRHHHFGEGEYEQSEVTIQHLLVEAGSGGVSRELVSDLVAVAARGIESAADWSDVRSPENYLGFERTDGCPERCCDASDTGLFTLHAEGD